DQLRQATDQLRFQLHIKDDLDDNVSVVKFSKSVVPIPPSVSDIRSGSGDPQGLGLSNQFSKKSEVRCDSSILDGLLVTSPRGSALPPIAPTREVHNMSPSMSKGSHYVTGELPVGTVEIAEDKVAVAKKQESQKIPQTTWTIIIVSHDSRQSDSTRFVCEEQENNHLTMCTIFRQYCLCCNNY
ncbi:hypothetical protein AHF37_00562, partial [Paragonimus kellicotti]